MYSRLRRVMAYLIVIDLIGTQVALYLADFTRRYVPLGEPVGGVETFLRPQLHLIVLLVYPVTFVALQVYDLRRDSRPVGEPLSLMRAVLVGAFVFAGVLYFTYREVPRLLVVYFAVIQLALLAGARLLMGGLLRLRSQGGRPLSRVLLAGTGDVAKRVADEMRTRLGEAVVVLGCVDDEPAGELEGLPLLGKLADVPGLVQTLAVDDVIVALPASQYLAVEKLVYALLTLPVRVRLVPDYLRLVVVQSSLEALGDIPMIGLREPRITGVAWAIKRSFDMAATLALLLLTWPLMVIIAIAIRLDSPGPALFRQERVGENGKLFKMYKFRTMWADADKRGPQLGFDKEGHAIYKWPNDVRVTRVGHWLRRTSLDEMPQFFNILRGDMSLVGPRPEMRFLVERYDAWQRQRLAVPPGLTGWWQVNGRSDLPMHLNTQFDLYYIRNYSLWLDVKILWKTVWVVVRGQGAY